MPNNLSQHGPQFVIEANCSLSWRGNQIFFLSLCCLSFGIAGVFAWLGLWMILPFAGFEMLALGIALYLCWYKTMRKEVISIEDNRIIVDIYAKKHKISYTFPRYWTRIILIPAPLSGHPNKLCMRSHGHQIEVGQMLRDEERKSLADALNKAIPIQVPPQVPLATWSEK